MYGDAWNDMSSEYDICVEKKLAFRNSLGYYSQWFTKNQLNNFLGSETEPIPINVPVNNKIHTFGHIFTDRMI